MDSPVTLGDVIGLLLLVIAAIDIGISIGRQSR